MPELLMIHGRYRQAGGEDVSVAAEAAVLRQAGWSVDVLVVPPLPDGAGRLKALWNAGLYAAVTDRLTRRPVDLIHVQNFFPAVSRAVHVAARRAGVPILQSLRNGRFLCPAGTLWRDGQGLCDSCAGAPWMGVLRGCWHGPAATLVSVAAHRLPWPSPDLYVAPSQALRLLLAPVIDPARVRVVPNRLAEDPCPGGPPRGPRSGVVFAGRLVPEKGVAVLAEAMKTVSAPLRVFGQGPLSALLPQAMPVPHAAVLAAMREAAVVVVPSLWPEAFGRTALEAMACGAAVVVSGAGALPEVVGDAGIVVPAGDTVALADGLRRALDHHEALGAAGRSRYLKRFADPEPLLAVLEEAAHLRPSRSRTARAANSGTTRA